MIVFPPIRSLETSNSTDLHFTIQLGFFVHNILLDELLLCLTEIQMLHLGLEHVPGLLALSLVGLQLIIATLNVSLRILRLLFHLLRDISWPAL